MAGGTHAVQLSPGLFFGQYNIGPCSNAHSIAQSVDLPDDSCYGDTFKQRLIGNRDMNFSIAGNMDLADDNQDELMISRIAVADVPLIICTGGSAVGDPCEFGRIGVGAYSPQLSHGQVAKFQLTGNIMSRKWIRGRILWSSGTQVTGTGSAAEVQLGAVSATQKLYVAICIFGFGGAGSITVRVESDATGFASATTQKTFTAATTITSEMPTPVDGAIADDYYRATVSAFSPTSVDMIVVAGIQ